MLSFSINCLGKVKQVLTSQTGNNITRFVGSNLRKSEWYHFRLMCYTYEFRDMLRKHVS